MVGAYEVIVVCVVVCLSGLIIGGLAWFASL